MSAALRPQAEVNITPLIDVLLVLIIIFMPVVPITPRGLDAGLPPAAAPQQSAAEALVITIDGSGLALNGQPVATPDDLQVKLADLLAARRDRTVFVGATGAVPYSDVVQAMDAAQGAGAARIGLLPRPAPTR